MNPVCAAQLLFGRASRRPLTNRRISITVFAETGTSSLLSPPSPIQWRQADLDVYAGLRDGEFAGYIVVDGGAYRVYDAVGRHVHTCPTLEQAQAEASTAARPARRDQASLVHLHRSRTGAVTGHRSVRRLRHPHRASTDTGRHAQGEFA